MSSPKRKPLPSFSTEEEEREFWATHDSSDYVDWATAQRGSFASLKPTLRTISLRLPEAMIGQLKVLANKRDIPYQSLLKQFLAERLQQELSRPTGPG
jgi:predicted DNA binding CopG/RHH family protein